MSHVDGVDDWVGYGVYGKTVINVGVVGESNNGYDVYDLSNNLDGKSWGQLKIDHPLDPANESLCHSFVELPDMKNVYDSMITLDNKGEAEIDLPSWFGALNKDYRYQLTAIAAPGPNLYIAKEISESSVHYTDTANDNNHNRSSFRIAGGTSGMKVSWQVTGIRKDPWANAHRIEVEQDKPHKGRGYYMHPDLYGQPADKGTSSKAIIITRHHVL